MRRSSEVYRRALDRRRRQDDALRLRDAAPLLDSLVVDIVERRAGLPGHEVHHKRVIVVDRAPALFEVPCSDRACVGGGHDLTAAVLEHVGRRDPEFAGVDACPGRVHGRACDYELHFEARATYRRDLSARP